MEDLVVVKSTTMVQPRNVVKKKKINLTPWDLLRLHFPYPQRAGRLVKEVNEEDDTVSYFISCDGDGLGVKFVHAEAKTIAVKDLVKSGFVDGLFGSLFFPATGIKNYQAKANEEIGSEEDGEISSFQAVLGHIWRSRVKNGGMGTEEETHCRVPIDMRQRLNPKLKEECFGNVIQTGIAKVNVGEMLDHGLGWLAQKINQMVRSQTDENAKAFAENWVKINAEIPVSVSGTLLVTSCPRFNVYGNDFGWGKPIGLRSGPPFTDGKLVVFQGVKEGDIEFQACFPPQVVVKLFKDGEFLEYVDIVS
ncbi:hypothetical protein AALP_AA8G511200 [Arabis alpina]|uniref:Uncharacterized protein n=1 Tax=Arabis alpina TaxID=50452 RepID=A0A087GEV8_ARAAL|nr:hypothetical protein AALP_AA8G511200 [Arabis alpina]